MRTEEEKADRRERRRSRRRAVFSLRGALVAIVTSLFVVALAESLAALRLVADEAAVSIPEPWPWIVDGFILAMTLVIVEARRAGRPLPGVALKRVRLSWARVGLYGATLISFAVQVSYAPKDLADRAVHGLAPVALLWSFECLMWLLYGQTAPVRRQALEGPAALPAPGPPVEVEVEEELVERRTVEQTRRTRTPSSNGTQASRIRELDGQGLDAAAIVAATGFNADTVKRTLRRADRA